MGYEQAYNFSDVIRQASLNENLLEARIELNTVCNLRCVHCYLPEHINKGLSYEEVEDLFYELRKLGVYNLTLTGGEIFCRKDILEIVKRARELGFNLSLFSNVSLLNEEIIKQLSELYIDKISCTLFSMNETINDNIMGKQGSTKLILDNIDLLIKYNIDVEVKTVLMNSNAFEYKDIAKYCKEKNINHIVSVNVTKKFLEDDANVMLRVHDGELEKIFLDDSLRLLKKNNVSDNDYICEKLRYSLFINSEGNVYPCDTFSESCGNIKQQSISEIWNNSNKLKHYRNLKIKQLNSCKNCNKSKYCFKCPGITQLEEGDIDKPSALACQHANVRYRLLKGGVEK